MKRLQIFLVALSIGLIGSCDQIGTTCGSSSLGYVQQCSQVIPCEESNPCNCPGYTWHPEPCEVNFQFDDNAEGCGDFTIYRVAADSESEPAKAISLQLNHIRNDGGMVTYNLDDVDVSGELITYRGSIETHFCNDTPSELEILSKYRIEGGTVTVTSEPETEAVYNVTAILNDGILILESGDNTAYQDYYIEEIRFESAAVGWFPG